MLQAWRNFKGTHWTDDINVRDFIQNNYTPYNDDESFLVGPTEAYGVVYKSFKKKNVLRVVF